MQHHASGMIERQEYDRMQERTDGHHSREKNLHVDRSGRNSKRTYIPEEVVGAKAAQVRLAHSLVLEVVDDALLVVEVAVDAHQLICVGCCSSWRFWLVVLGDKAVLEAAFVRILSSVLVGGMGWGRGLGIRNPALFFLPLVCIDEKQNPRQGGPQYKYFQRQTRKLNATAATVFQRRVH